MKKIYLLLFIIVIFTQNIFATNLTMEMIRSHEKSLALYEFKAMYKERQYIQRKIKQRTKHRRSTSVKAKNIFHNRVKDATHNHPEMSQVFHPPISSLYHKGEHFRQLQQEYHFQKIPQSESISPVENTPYKEYMPQFKITVKVEK